jgi:SAM-dependent methyltransferase
MGIAFDAARLLAQNIRDFSIKDTVLQLGRQDIHITKYSLDKILLDTGFVSKTDKGLSYKHQELMGKLNSNDKLSDKSYMRAKGLISDKLLFGSMGMDAKSLDFSDYEGADFICDLNDPPEITSKCVKGQFDLIFDGGTMEHVFHVPNVMKNIFSLLKEGGIVIHSSPSNNHVDHGFYQFSPTFFYDWYHKNQFEILQCLFFQYTKFPEVDRWKVMDYYPGVLDASVIGGMDDKLYGVWCVARKTKKSTCCKIPQQGDFRKNQIDESILYLIEVLNNLAAGRDIVVFGAGTFGEKLISILRRFGIEPKYIFDNDINKQKQICSGIQVMDPHVLNKAEMFIVIASTWSHEITCQLEEMGYNSNEDFITAELFMS